MMYRLATMLALVMVLLVGCGGDSESEESSSPAPAVAQAPNGDSAEDAQSPESGSRPKDSRHDKSAKAEKKDSSKSTDQPGKKAPVSVKEQLENIPAKDVAKIIRDAARATLVLFGLDFAGAEISDKGRTVNVLVTQGSACRAVAKDEPAMASRIQKAVPILKSVSFEVAGTGKQLGYYVLGCKRPEIPSGPGKVVFSRSGVGGPVNSKSFKIHGKRWAVEYENGAGFLAVIVGGEGAEGEYHKPVGSQKREVGRVVHKTGPGTYQLQIHGGGFWTVRVRDMG